MVCGVEWPPQDPKTYVLWKWQTDSSPTKVFLFMRICFLVYFFATAVICALNVNRIGDKPVSNFRNSFDTENERFSGYNNEDSTSTYIRYDPPPYYQTFGFGTTSIGLFLGGEVVHLYYSPNRFLIYGMIAALTCSLVQHLWATITLLLFNLNNENYVSWARSYKIYVITQRISHDFSFMLMVTHWAVYDFPDKTVRLIFGLDSVPTKMCFVAYYPMCVIEVLMIRHKISVTHFVISMVASIVLMLITLSVMLGLDEIYKYIDNIHGSQKRNFDARLFDEPIIWFLGFHMYAFAILMCIASHALFILIQILRDLLKNDDEDVEAPVAA